MYIYNAYMTGAIPTVYVYILLASFIVITRLQSGSGSRTSN